MLNSENNVIGYETTTNNQAMGVESTQVNSIQVENRDLKLLFVNVQGLKNKIEELEVIQAENNYSVMCLAEHWLISEEVELWVPEGLVLANNFCRSQHIHGGVSIYVAEGVKFKILDLTRHCREVHFEVTGIIAVETNIIIISLYRSPLGRADIFLESLDNLLKQLTVCHNGPNIIISGDLNAEFDVTTTKSTVSSLSNSLRQYGLYCINDNPTRGESCLDNILTNIGSQNYILKVVDLDLADHLALQLEVSLGQVGNSPYGGLIQVQKRIMSRKNIEYFKMLLEREDWLNLHSSSSANECFEGFFNKLLSLFEISFPLVTIKSKENRGRKIRPSLTKGLNWYTPELETMKNFILICKEMYRKEKSTRLLTTLKTLKSQYKSAVREAKKRKNEEVIENSSNKCKAAWSIINKAIGKKQPDGHQTSTTPDVFNQFFITSVEEISAKVNATTAGAMQKLQEFDVLKPETGCVFSVVPAEEILNTVMSLKTSATMDVYGISNDLFKEIINVILLPLTYCLNLCILEGVFPESLKFSRVVPILKKGNVDDPSNYRPISCIPTIAKVLEKILKSQVCQYFELYNLFSQSQFGYRSGRSTVQAIDSLVYNLLLTLEKKHSAQVTLCDLSRAFDTVQHDILLGKLSFYGFKGKDLAIFRSYLDGRKQLVDRNGVHSQVLDVKLGVPQGSVLGPILFLIVINDLSFNVTNCLSTIYADDTSLLVSHQDFAELKVLADSCLTDANLWFETNGLFLNVDKTQTLLVSLRTSAVSNDNVKLLGITVDSNLSWKAHIETVCKKLSRVIFLLANLKRQVTTKYLKMSYYAFFESIIRYGLIVWGNGVDIEKVLLLQKKAVRILTSSDYLDHCKPLFKETGILTVVNLYIFNVLMSVKQNVNCLSLRSNVHDHKTRNRNNLDLPRCRLSKTMSYHRYIGIKLYNKLPLAWQHLSHKKFAVILYEWLSKNPFYEIDEYFKYDF